MEEKKYLNEEDYQRYTAKLKKVGKILLIVGLIIFIVSIGLIVAGSITFGSTIVTENSGSALGGMGLFAIGGFLSQGILNKIEKMDFMSQVDVPNNRFQGLHHQFLASALAVKQAHEIDHL